jgi:hypothetical protein
VTALERQLIRRARDAAARSTAFEGICRDCLGPLPEFGATGRRLRKTAKFCSDNCRKRHSDSYARGLAVRRSYHVL